MLLRLECPSAAHRLSYIIDNRSESLEGRAYRRLERLQYERHINEDADRLESGCLAAAGGWGAGRVE